MTVFIFSVVLLAVLGILIGILLGVAGKVFAVETDERVEKVRGCGSRKFRKTGGICKMCRNL